MVRQMSYTLRDSWPELTAAMQWKEQPLCKEYLAVGCLYGKGLLSAAANCTTANATCKPVRTQQFCLPDQA